MKINLLNQRILDYANHKRLTAFEFSGALGYQSTTEFYRVQNGGEVKDAFILKMCKAFPLLNKEWLLEGKGDMETYPTMASEPESPIYGVTKIIDIEHDPNGRKIPVYDTDIYASIIPSLSDEVTMTPKAFISIPIFLNGEASMQVTGDSMKGVINNGDWIVIRRIYNWDVIVPNEIYMVITRSDRLKAIKYINVSEDKNMVKLVPHNRDHETHYIHKEDIIEIWKVIGRYGKV
jgi:hypothetical protein